MLAKRLRLRKRKEFARVMRGGRGFANDFVVVYVRPVPRREIRAGFSITRKFGTAVQRNRAKRRLRHAFLEAVREVFPELFRAVVRGVRNGPREDGTAPGEGRGLRVVVIGKAGLKRVPFKEVEETVARILKEALEGKVERREQR